MSRPAPLSIIQVCAEIKPYSKTGGLADVTGALPGALAGLGHSVITITPLHRLIDPKKWGLKLISARNSLQISTRRWSYRVWEKKERDGTCVWFIDQSELFRRRHRLYGYPDGNLRYYFFCRAALDFIQNTHTKVDVIHCHDWHAGVIPNLLHREDYIRHFADTATVMTIHNIAFQMSGTDHHLPPSRRDDGTGYPSERLPSLKRLNFMLRGVKHADAISTVSARYALEIQTPEFGCGLEKILHRRRRRLFGILNGIDYNHFDPRHDKYLPVPYHLNDLHKKRRNKSALQQAMGLEVDDNIPIIGLASRITEQKGFELIFEILDQLMTRHVQAVIVGSGQPEYEKRIRTFHQKYPDKLGIYLEFSEEVASLVYAGSDLFLMPSRFEPCGLGQMIALRYGTIPIVHEVGGLADTIKNYDPAHKSGNGFVFTDFTAEALLEATLRGLEAFKYRDRWEKLMRHGMSQSYSWELPARQYIRLYRFARGKQRQRTRVRWRPAPQLKRRLTTS